ncbi:hypothetical protein [Kamptonema formosum]|uniref:hypothetical protein n=1 Tax=Kamptonema formosum TaxID=331992 RepID=UPI00034988F5|nr:hypothetical protein [Oscillatoria sp. PCC 10802]
MATDYILFIHGVNTREKREQPAYADKLFKLIQGNAGSSLKLKKITLYWGDVNKTEEEKLLTRLKASNEIWDKLWFKDFRANQLLQFAGDAALYLSRHVGSNVVERLKDQARTALYTPDGSKRYNPETDRLHLVTHSWGTVILFDILFADRWGDENTPEAKRVPGSKDVMEIREFLSGLAPNPGDGIRLASIHTMGSPLALFSLISVNGSSHDFQPLLNQMLEALYKRVRQQLPWINFIHPGDPVAWPLANLMFDLVDDEEKYLDFQDAITQKADFSDWITESVSQTMLALLHGGDAHDSYWRSEEVAKRIAETIKKTSAPPL